MPPNSGRPYHIHSAIGRFSALRCWCSIYRLSPVEPTNGLGWPPSMMGSPPLDGQPSHHLTAQNSRFRSMAPPELEVPNRPGRVPADGAGIPAVTVPPVFGGNIAIPAVIGRSLLGPFSHLPTRRRMMSPRRFHRRIRKSNHEAQTQAMKKQYPDAFEQRDVVRLFRIAHTCLASCISLHRSVTFPKMSAA